MAKENIIDSTKDIWSAFNKLRVVDFDWKDPQRGTERQTGLIAQEVYDVPELRQYVVIPNNKDPNELAKPLKEQKGWSMKYHLMVPELIKGLRELKAENIELGKRIRALETTR